MTKVEYYEFSYSVSHRGSRKNETVYIAISINKKKDIMKWIKDEFGPLKELKSSTEKDFMKADKSDCYVNKNSIDWGPNQLSKKEWIGKISEVVEDVDSTKFKELLSEGYKRLNLQKLQEKSGNVRRMSCDIDEIYDIDLPGKEGKDWEYDDKTMARGDRGGIIILTQSIVKDIEKAAKKAGVKMTTHISS